MLKVAINKDDDNFSLSINNLCTALSTSTVTTCTVSYTTATSTTAAMCKNTMDTYTVSLLGYVGLLCVCDDTTGRADWTFQSLTTRIIFVPTSPSNNWVNISLGSLGEVSFDMKEHDKEDDAPTPSVTSDWASLFLQLKSQSSQQLQKQRVAIRGVSKKH